MEMRLVKHLLKEGLKILFRKIFELGQKLGVDLLPRHFYSEIPDISVLKCSDAWRNPYSMTGIAGISIQQQLEFVSECCPPQLSAAIQSKNILANGCERNGATGYGVIEADFLYAFVSTKKPKQIFQIGCGVSTAICLLAAKDAGYQPEIICVEPYPTPFLVRAHEQGEIRLIKEKAQDINLDLISGLSDNVLFFVDSTHTLGPAGEVSRIILEMLPRLKSGAWAHFHDIFFPYDYAPSILKSSLVFWHESVLLHAFLAYNNRFTVKVSLSMLHYAAPKQLAGHLANYQPAIHEQGLEVSSGHFPSSTYLRVIS
jgi:hypothetical protein